MTTSSPPSLSPASRRHSTYAREVELVAALRRGDDEAYTALVHEHGERMLSLARRIMGREHDALDAVQDALLGAFRSIDRFEQQSKLATWLHRIVVNACLMAKRRRRRRPEVSLDDLPTSEPDVRATPQASPIEMLLEREVSAKVRHAIMRLPDGYRRPLELRHEEGRSLREIAGELELSPGTIKTRLYRARSALRPSLEAHIYGHSRSA